MSKKKLTTFGETIRRLREEQKLPQRKVAAYLDIDTSLLAKYERNVRQPSKELIKKIATLFKVVAAELRAVERAAAAVTAASAAAFAAAIAANSA